jgi:hypothetical protein
MVLKELNFMKFLEKAKALVLDKTVNDGTVNFLGDSASALLGDPVAAGKLLYSVSRSPLTIRDQFFWLKFEMFLNGIDVSDKERENFCKRLTEDGTKRENPYRLIQAIDRTDTKNKIQYLINASRCLSISFIELPLYFRICHTITNSLEEDLLFLAEHVLNDYENDYSTVVQALMNNGLVYQSVFDENGKDRYKFTSLASDLDRFAISYDNVERYPNPEKKNEDKIQYIRTVNVVAKFG